MEQLQFSTGLVSITFRKSGWKEVLKLCQKTGVEGIEWGGDVHVPHGEKNIAEEVGEATRKAGLDVVAYGSYYRIGVSPQEGLPFEKVLSSAVALKAPVIRVWAGKKGSADFSEIEFEKLVLEAREICEKAEKEGIRIALEFHGNTQTDSAEAAVRYLKEVNHPNLKCLWQPSVNGSPQERMEDLRAIMPWLEHVHVFHWDQREKKPLKEGAGDWMKYFLELRNAGKECPCLIEFVRGETFEQFEEDAQVLKEWIQK